ncbi:CLUMA_CG019160, isoform A [Clunio marinus]|uniref:CLUMA_CG019160, isoform A n=1 Tax=Clunio marinus TaxID=568069 RepID=A0A1J1J3P6_9DIPT|nr:CLUMA_CG019160, isoform A [Clunio marinus]
MANKETERQQSLPNFKMSVNSRYAKMRHNCELTLKYDSVIDKCDELTTIPIFTYDFLSISDIAAKEVGTFINVIAICKEATEKNPNTIFSKNSPGFEFKSFMK